MIKRVLGLTAPCLIAGAAAPLPEPGLVEVTVAGVRSDRGQVLVAICDRATFLQERCAFRGRTPARAGSVLVRVFGVPPGIYAAQAFQDENGNGKVDRTLFGIPSEGIGFSRDARMRFGPPSFDDADFTMGSSAIIAVTLHYYD